MMNVKTKNEEMVVKFAKEMHEGLKAVKDEVIINCLKSDLDAVEILIYEAKEKLIETADKNDEKAIVFYGTVLAILECF